MLNVERRLAKLEQAIAPKGSFLDTLITLSALNRAEKALYLVEEAEMGEKVSHLRPDPDGSLARAVQEAEAAHYAAMERWIESMSPRDRDDFLSRIGGGQQ
jgi:hypothetical protein